MNIYKKSTSELYYSFNIDTTLPASNPLRFTENLLLTYKNDTN